MTREQFYLQCLAEECSEVAQAVSKCLIFGTMTKIPASKGGDGERNNRDHLNDEIHDVTVLVERLQLMGTIATWVSPVAHEMRQQKLGQKLYDAECLGMVDA